MNPPTSKNQRTIFYFKTEFQSKLDANNRWVKVDKLLDCDKLVAVYAQNFSSTKGVIRVVIAALIIKYIEAKHIKEKFGQGKTKYKLNQIVAKLEQTSLSWIAARVF